MVNLEGSENPKALLNSHLLCQVTTNQNNHLLLLLFDIKHF